MKRYVKLAVVVWLVLGVSLAGAKTPNTAKTPKPATPAKSEVKTYTGTLKVTKDKAGTITGAKLSVGKVLPHTYDIALDKEGKELAEKMDGKLVQVRGTMVKQKEGARLTVKDFRATSSKPAAKPTTKPAKK